MIVIAEYSSARCPLRRRSIWRRREQESRPRQASFGCQNDVSKAAACPTGALWRGRRRPRPCAEVCDIRATPTNIFPKTGLWLEQIGRCFPWLPACACPVFGPVRRAKGRTLIKGRPASRRRQRGRREQVRVKGEEASRRPLTRASTMAPRAIARTSSVCSLAHFSFWRRLAWAQLWSSRRAWLWAPALRAAKRSRAPTSGHRARTQFPCAPCRFL